MRARPKPVTATKTGSFVEKIITSTNRNIDFINPQNKAEKQQKGQKMSVNRAISSDDPQAIEKLAAKLEACQKQQEYMKSVNAYYRKFGTMRGFPDLSEEQADKMDATVRSGYSWEKVPFAPYYLSNNNTEIRRLKQRLESLKQSRETGYTGWTFAGGKAVANTENNRLQLLFDEKPDAEKRTVLKQNGFHWAPSERAWQRQLNDNAIYAAGRIDFIRPENGESPMRLQPKAKRPQEQER